MESRSRLERPAVEANCDRCEDRHERGHQKIACNTGRVVAPPIESADPSAVTETGWFRANACSHPGMNSTAMNTDDANTSGASTGKAAACAVSGP